MTFYIIRHNDKNKLEISFHTNSSIITIINHININKH